MRTFSTSSGILSRVAATSFISLRLAPSMASPTGIPLASTSRLRLAPFLARSVGLAPVFFPSQGGLGHRSIHGAPFPVQTSFLIILQKRCLPELLEDSRFGPLLKARMRRRATANPRRIECFPRTARLHDKEDPVHYLAIVHPPSMTTQWMPPGNMHRQIRLYSHPKLITDSPLIFASHPSL